MTINFNTFAEIWRKETFMAAAFNEMEDFDSFLDSLECGVGNPFFDEYANEINDIMLPTKLPHITEVDNWDKI